jgi:hypothetical protein
MNNSNDLAIPAPVFGCDFIQAAHLRVVQMHASAAHPMEAPTLLELEQALGEPVKKCELRAPELEESRLSNRAGERPYCAGRT